MRFVLWFVYQIPYRILLPRGIEGLLPAGRCVSTDRMTNDSIRQQVGCLVTGQAAGTAAAIAAKEGILPREVKVSQLQDLLREQGAII